MEIVSIFILHTTANKTNIETNQTIKMTEKIFIGTGNQNDNNAQPEIMLTETSKSKLHH